MEKGNILYVDELNPGDVVVTHLTNYLILHRESGGDRESITFLRNDVFSNGRTEYSIHTTRDDFKRLRHPSSNRWVFISDYVAIIRSMIE